MQLMNLRTAALSATQRTLNTRKTEIPVEKFEPINQITKYENFTKILLSSQVFMADVAPMMGNPEE